MKNLYRRLIAAGAAYCAAVAFAQQAPTRMEYRSAFDGYRGFQEPDTRSWRDANNEAGVLGGHVGQMKAVMPTSPGAKPQQQPDDRKTPAAAKSVTTSPPAGAHQGHSK